MALTVTASSLSAWVVSDSTLASCDWLESRSLPLQSYTLSHPRKHSLISVNLVQTSTRCVVTFSGYTFHGTICPVVLPSTPQFILGTLTTLTTLYETHSLLSSWHGTPCAAHVMHQPYHSISDKACQGLAGVLIYVQSRVLVVL